METINLDKFSATKKVNIPDAGEFTLRLYTVGDFIDGAMATMLENAGDEKASASFIVDFVEQYSDIPKTVLLKQSMTMLTALSVIIQGGDPLAGGGPEGNG